MGEGTGRQIKREDAITLIMMTYVEFYNIIDSLYSYAKRKNIAEAEVIREIYTALNDVYGIVTRRDRRNIYGKVYDNLNKELAEAGDDELMALLQECYQLAILYNLNIQSELPQNVLSFYTEEDTENELETQVPETNNVINAQPNIRPQTSYNPNNFHCDILAHNSALENNYDPRAQNGNTWDGNVLTISQIYLFYPDNRTNVPTLGTAGYEFSNFGAEGPRHMEFYDYTNENDTYIRYETNGINPQVLTQVNPETVINRVFVPLPSLLE